MNNRLLSILFSPEVVLSVFTAAILWFCSRHASGEGHDVELMERLVWLLPLLVVPLAFSTVFAPGAKNWWWLARTVVFIFVALCVCGGRAITGFGSGAKGQDGAIIIIFTFGLILVSVGIAISGAIILCATRPGVTEWFKARRVIAPILTLLAAVPIGLVLGFVIVIAFSVIMEFRSTFKR